MADVGIRQCLHRMERTLETIKLWKENLCDMSTLYERLTPLSIVNQHLPFQKFIEEKKRELNCLDEEVSTFFHELNTLLFFMRSDPTSLTTFPVEPAHVRDRFYRLYARLHSFQKVLDGISQHVQSVAPLQLPTLASKSTQHRTSVAAGQMG